MSVLMVSACGTTAGRGKLSGGVTAGATPPARVHVAAKQPSLSAEGTSSTPGVFQLPQMGFVSFRCDRSWRVQPFFDTRGASSAEAVTIWAGRVVRRNFKTRTVGHSHGKPLRETSYSSDPVLALPYAHYGRVVFTAETGDEARELRATVAAQFVAGVFAQKDGPALGGCYVKRWNVSMSVNPY